MISGGRISAMALEPGMTMGTTLISFILMSISLSDQILNWSRSRKLLSSNSHLPNWTRKIMLQRRPPISQNIRTNTSAIPQRMLDPRFTIESLPFRICVGRDILNNLLQACQVGDLGDSSRYPLHAVWGGLVAYVVKERAIHAAALGTAGEIPMVMTLCRVFVCCGPSDVVVRIVD